MGLGVLTRMNIDENILALRSRFGETLGRLRVGALPIVQTAVAASLSWFLASAVLGHERPFFAAIAAVISLGVVVGQEGRRVLELVFGVACGLAVADVLVRLIGTGTVQIGVVIALAMAVAWLLGGGPMLVSEAGVTALFTVMLDPTTSGWSPDRFLDAALGAGVALAVRAVFPSDPREIVERAAHPIFADLVDALKETAAALRVGNLEMAEHALQKARETDACVASLKEALDAGYDTAKLSPPRRRALGQLGFYATAADQLDLAVRNVRVLARAAVSMVREGTEAPEELSDTILDLAHAVEALATYIEEPEHPLDTRRFALEAAAEATAVLKDRNDLQTSMLVGQIRSTAVDLLRASGMTHAEALEALREAAHRAAEQPAPAA
jgi:uncharacterized membrane protein YgaE (UPF0421/DUF939 family)